MLAFRTSSKDPPQRAVTTSLPAVRASFVEWGESHVLAEFSESASENSDAPTTERKASGGSFPELPESELAAAVHQAEEAGAHAVCQKLMQHFGSEGLGGMAADVWETFCLNAGLHSYFALNGHDLRDIHQKAARFEQTQATVTRTQDDSDEMMLLGFPGFVYALDRVAKHLKITLAAALEKVIAVDVSTMTTHTALARRARIRARNDAYRHRRFVLDETCLQYAVPRLLPGESPTSPRTLALADTRVAILGLSSPSPRTPAICLASDGLSPAKTTLGASALTELASQLSSTEGGAYFPPTWSANLTAPLRGCERPRQWMVGDAGPSTP